MFVSGQHLSSGYRKSEGLRGLSEFQRRNVWGTKWGIIFSLIKYKLLINKVLYIISGGEGGIRTRVGATNPLTAFEAAPL